MAIFILGCGRSGTNLLLEILSGSSLLSPSISPENKNLFLKPKEYSNNYITKCDTIYIEEDKIEITISYNLNAKILFTIRHPYDMILSKIYRGQPYQKGGDNPILAADATEKGVLNNLFHMKKIYEFLNNKYPNKVKLVKMEDIILNFETTIQNICMFLEIPFENNFYNFPDRMRNKFKKKRYNNLDKTQVKLYKRIDEIYNGFFSKSKYNIHYLFNEVVPICNYFKYAI